MIKVTLHLTTGEIEVHYVADFKLLEELVRELGNPYGFISFRVDKDPNGEPIEPVVAVYSTRQIVKIVHSIKSTETAS